MEEKLQNAAELAADKLTKEKAEALEPSRLEAASKKICTEKKLDAKNKNVLDAMIRMRSSMIEEVCRTLTRFSYQNEEFADEVLKCKRSLSEAVDVILGKVSGDKPSLSDVEAYALAVQFYIPSAQVTVSFRLNIPTEIDEDLFGLGDEEEGSHAIILDLFDAEG
jgi:hypothetical protein